MISEEFNLEFDIDDQIISSDTTEYSQSFPTNLSAYDEIIPIDIVESDSTIGLSLSPTVTEAVEFHQNLAGRSLSDQHPISAITNLQTELDTKITQATAQTIANNAVKNIEKLNHSITIGTLKFDGSANITIPVYKGDYDDTSLLSVSNDVEIYTAEQSEVLRSGQSESYTAGQSTIQTMS